jgi:hypothetical protein
VKFISLLEKAVQSTKLQRVRIKVDPVWSEKLGIMNSPHYEGYILQECPGSKMEFKVFIVNTPSGIDPVQTVSKAHIEPMDVENSQETEKVSKFNGSRLSVFKKHLVEKLKELGKDLESADVQQTISSNDISFIETYLKQMGLNDEDILNLYRKTLQK